MPFKCLVGCVSDYLANSPGLRKPINEAMLMPWVEISIIGEGKKISVGNFTARKSLASVQSFQFGVSNGNGITVEIIDEEGGSFSTFLSKITTGNLESGASRYLLQFQFGWATTSCVPGRDSTFGEAICCPVNGLQVNRSYRSCIHTMTVRSIGANINSGMFHFTITATDMTTDMFTTRSFDVRGRENSPMPLTQAIRELFRQFNVDVEFRRLVGPCNWEPMRFNVNGDSGCLPGVDVALLGPCGTWRSVGRNPIQAAREWLNGCLTDRRRGIVSFWDLRPNQPRPTLVFMEATIPRCNEVQQGQYHLGTYLVNGSNCSPVISFTPEIKYLNPLSGVVGSGGVGGTAGNALMSSSFREQGPEPCLRGNTASTFQGFQNPVYANDNWFSLYGNQGLHILSAAKLENLRSNLINPGITAELKVQGDPSFDTPVLLQGHYIGIIYLNPFRAVSTGNGCDYLSTGCQRELSNTNWMVRKVFHEIREGSFVTTMSLILAAPGSEINRDAPLGGMRGAPTIPQDNNNRLPANNNGRL